MLNWKQRQIIFRVQHHFKNHRNRSDSIIYTTIGFIPLILKVKSKVSGQIRKLSLINSPMMKNNINKSPKRCENCKVP